MRSAKRNKKKGFESKPVGSLPYQRAPRCGLFKTALTDSPPPGASSAIRRLHSAVHSAFSEEAGTSTQERDPFDVLSVSALVEPLSEAKDCGVILTATSRRTATEVQFLYDIPNDFVLSSSQPQRDRRRMVAFFFPFSECGPHVESFRAELNGLPLLGEVVRVRRCDQRLVSSHGTHRQAFLGETSDMSDDGEADEEPEAPKGPRASTKLLYYYVVPDIQLTMYLPWKPPCPSSSEEGADDGSATAAGPAVKDTRGSPTNTTPFAISVSWRCQAVTEEEAEDRKVGGRVKGVYHSLYCTPHYPKYVSLLVRLDSDQRIRVVRSPNCRGSVVLRSRIAGSTAKVELDTVLRDPLQRYRLPEDYLLVFEVFLGDASETMEGMHTKGVTVLLLTLAFSVWFFLTRDLLL